MIRCTEGTVPLKKCSHFLKTSSTCLRMPGETSTFRPVYSNLMTLVPFLTSTTIEVLAKLPISLTNTKNLRGLNSNLRVGAACLWSKLLRDAHASREYSFDRDTLRPSGAIT